MGVAAYTDPITPIYTGLTLKDVVMAIMTRHPANTPAQPMPARARPTIKTSLLGATPQIRLPSSKINSEPRNDHRTSKWANTRPNIGWKAHAVSRYFVKGQLWKKKK